MKLLGVLFAFVALTNADPVTEETKAYVQAQFDELTKLLTDTVTAYSGLVDQALARAEATKTEEVDFMKTEFIRGVELCEADFNSAFNSGEIPTSGLREKFAEAKKELSIPLNEFQKTDRDPQSQRTINFKINKTLIDLVFEQKRRSGEMAEPLHRSLNKFLGLRRPSRLHK